MGPLFGSDLTFQTIVHMNKIVLNKLIQVNEYPSISIIFPTHRTAPEYQKNSIRLKRLLREAEDRLIAEFGKREAKSLVEKLKQLAADVDISRTQDGLALFVNPSISELVHIPFRVRERVIIDKTFATRDLIRGVNRATHYYILDLSMLRARLISCNRDKAQEMTENGFPFLSEFPMLQLDSSDFSKEKEKQIKEFFNRVDKLFLSNYRVENTRLVLSGVTKNLSFYREVTGAREIIFATLEGNHEALSAHDLCKKAWKVVRELTRKERHNALNDLQRAVSTRKFASGIKEIWRLAIEGRIDMLVTEEDFHVSAGIQPGNTLVLDTSDLPEESIIPDAVNEVAEIVIEKGGRVVFVDNGTLGNFYKIAAVLRY